MADNSVTIEVELLDKATKSLVAINGRLDELAKTAEKTSKKTVSAFDVFTSTLGSGIALQAIGKLESAAVSLFNTFVVDGIRAATEYEDAVGNLKIALAQTGDLTPELIARFKSFGDQIERTTKFSDDAAISAAALIQQISGVGPQNLEALTLGAINLASAFGKDLESAAVAVGKAANGSTEALGRFGIKIEEGSTKAQTLQAVLAELAKRNNAASAAINTYSGAIAFANNQFESLKQTIGLSLVQNISVINTIKAIGQEFGFLSDGVEQGNKSLRIFVAETLVDLIEASSLVARALVFIVEIFRTVQNAVSYTGVVILKFVLEIVNGFLKAAQSIGLSSDLMTASILGIQESIEQLSKQSKTDLEQINQSLSLSRGPLNETAEAFDRIKAAAEEGLKKTREGATADVEVSNNRKKALEEEAALRKKQIEDLDKFLEKEKEEALTAEDVARRRLEALQIYAEQKSLTQTQIDDAEKAILAQEEEDRAAAAQKRYDELIAENEQLLIIDDAASQQRIAANQAEIDSILNNEREGSKLQLKIKSDQIKKEKELNTQRLTATKEIFGNIAQTAAAFGRDGFEIFKAASVAEAIVAGILAVQKALASAPPPFNIVLAASIGALTAANVAKIASSKPPGLKGGIDSIPGSGFSDSFGPVMLAPGERVVPRRSNEDLTAFLAQQNGSSAILASIDAKLDRLQNQFTVNIGGNTIVSEIRNALDSGRVLAV